MTLGNKARQYLANGVVSVLWPVRVEDAGAFVSERHARHEAVPPADRGRPDRQAEEALERAFSSAPEVEAPLLPKKTCVP